MQFLHLLTFLFVLAWKSETVLSRNAVHQVRHDVAFVHTFDTREMCMSSSFGVIKEHLKIVILKILVV
uniref:Secreted protein n=1 Tax=Caenorhabditis japonica TaxID=281687 RepID=A0A8R1DKN1_CAEJA